MAVTPTEMLAPFLARRKALVMVAAMSAVINVLMLGGAFFMLLVYDEVLPSRSTASLIGLLAIVITVYLFHATLDHLRSRMALHISAAFQRTLSDRAFRSVLNAELNGVNSRASAQPIRDLDQIRNFLGGPGPLALCDMPWVLLFLAILFIFHPLLGVVALLGALVLIGLTLLTDRVAGPKVRQASEISADRANFVEACRRNAEVVHALGMQTRASSNWMQLGDLSLALNGDLSTRVGLLKTAGKTFRMFLQSLLLACGAYLVINDKASAGIIIAGSILSARMLAPIESAISHWRSFVECRQAWHRLRTFWRDAPESGRRLELPPPTGTLSVNGLTVCIPGTQQPIVTDVSFQLKKGDTLALIGASGSGKTSLAKALVGIWPPGHGTIRLDGAAIAQWDPDVLGQSIGYLPQDIGLFDGSIADNIARFDRNAPDIAVLKAAQDAGIHDMIVRLPGGYDTMIGANGRNLSAGQRQRIALARALYGDPFLVVLDEANSNLDAEGDAALNAAIRRASDRGAIVIIIAHRPSALAEIDQILWLNGGRIRALGSKNHVLPMIMNTPAQPQSVTATAQPEPADA